MSVCTCKDARKNGSGASSREDPLQKPDGGVRGFTEERPTHAFPRRAATEFLIHIVHSLTKLHFVRGRYWCHQLLETERRSSASISIHLGKEAQELELRCRHVQHVLSLASTLHSTACCCCDVSVSHYLCPSVAAGVAVHSILVTTEQLARGQQSWEGRKRCGKDLSRGRCAGHDKRHGPRYGLGSTKPRRRPTVGDRRRWVAVVRGGEGATVGD